MTHRTQIVTTPEDRRKVLCSCGSQSERFDSLADAEEWADHHEAHGTSAPEDFDWTQTKWANANVYRKTKWANANPSVRVYRMSR